MRLPPLFLAPLVLTAATVTGIPYGESSPGVPLSMDFHAVPGPGLQPAAIVILTGLDHDVPALLVPAGMPVFTIGLAASGWRESAGQVRRAVRYVRHHAARWNVDPNRLVLIGGSTGGYIANLVGVMSGDPAPASKDPVERESAAVQAVVAFASLSDLRGQDLPPGIRALLARDIEAVGEKLASSGASPVMHIRDSGPPFLLLHGDRDETVPMSQSAHWQLALQNRGIRADLILIEGGGHSVSEWTRTPRVRDWQREMLEWLAAALARG